MNNIYTLDEIQSKVSPIAKRYNIENIWIIGSYARKEANADSDVDFLLSGFTKGGLLAFGHLYNDLSAALDKNVDIVNVEDLRHDTSNPITRRFIKSIKEDRALIYEKAEKQSIINELAINTRY